MKQYTEKEFATILTKNGYYHVRTSGSHSIYTNGVNTISVPMSHNCCILRRLIKENSLKVDD